MDGESKVLPMASAMFFGACIFATAALTVASLLGRKTSAIKQAWSPKALPLDLKSFNSIYSLLYQSSVLGLILFYAYICEHHPPYPHAPKSYNRDEFFFFTALLFLVAFFTAKKHTPVKELPSDVSPRTSRSLQVAPSNEATEILNRDQTEEWKGWMQFMFLLYHYQHAEEVYNAIRVMITCYVWMTGFGNMSFFYIKGDYSLVRVLQMLWRLNFLVFFLCWTQGTTYILYYICFLHTYYFFMVYLTMRIRSDLNYSSTGLRSKLMVLAVVIFIVWDINGGIFQLLHWLVLGDEPILGATYGTGWEVYFRTSLDHWSTFLGMVFACNFPIVSLFFRRIEAEPLCKHVMAKTVIAVPLLVAVALWIAYPFRQSKFHYNQTNAFLAPIPLIAYIYFRNLTPWLRDHTLELLHQIGKTTLETYLMQHHIWLTSDAKTLLTLIPGWPRVNFLLVSIIYVALSRRLYQLTLFLRGMILPNERSACLRNLGVMAALLGSFYSLASVLRAIGSLNLLSVSGVALGCGLVLFFAVEALADSKDTETTIESENGDNMAATTDGLRLNQRAHRLSLLAGVSALLTVGAILQTMRLHGASKTGPVPETCSSAVQTGQWIPVNLCESEFRGEAYRDHGISAISTCNPQNRVYSWGWKSTQSSSHCYFSQRDAAKLLSQLDHRTVTFVGDSIIRHLYHAFCRQVGDVNAGSYNTSLGKWQDYSRQYLHTRLEFRWAPFTDSMIETVSNISNANEVTDLLVIGGGAWDRLHRYSNKTEQETLKLNVGTLTNILSKLRASGTPVAWVTPTSVNTWALNTEEKRKNIREDQMAELRVMYEEVGLHEAASWILHGPSFTADRIAESYDGVHYPLPIYDGGAQILANALDWLVPDAAEPVKLSGPHIGAMAHPMYGFAMLVCITIALYTKDGFFGLSYLAGLVVPAARPSVLYQEAFANFHARMNIVKLPVSIVSRLTSYSSHDLDKSHSSDEGEMETLIETLK